MTKENNDKERFALLMYERSGAWEEQPPEEAKALLGRYFAWVDDLAGRGIFKGGEGLQNVGQTVKIVDGSPVDGPFAEAKEVIAGFFLLEAAHRAEALAIAQTCPALTHGRRLLLAPWCSEAGSPSAMLEVGPREGCFLMLCFESLATLQALSPRAQQDLLVQTIAWIDEMKQAGIFRYGEAFQPEGELLSSEGIAPVETDTRLTALYAIGAASMEEALSIAHRCPSLSHGAVLEVQPVWYVDAERN